MPMKKKTISQFIAHEYRKTIIIAVVGVVLTTLLIIFTLLFSNREVDLAKPKYLVLQIHLHISKALDQEFSLDKEGMNLLAKYNSWMQIVDRSGQVVFQENTPPDIPTQYSPLDLINYTLASDRLDGYTLYARGYENDSIILVGCSSKVMTKYSFSARGTLSQTILFCIVIFIIVSVLIIVILSKLFSKKITLPTSRVIDRIQGVGTIKAIETTTETNALYKDVFLSIDKLEHRLNENNQLRMQWISNISHDIKTPLSAIRGYAEMLSSNEYEFNRNEVAKYAEQMLMAEQNIESLLDDLKLSQALIERKAILNKETISFTELIESCVEAATVIQKPEDRIVCDYPDKETEEIIADKKLLQRAIVNIIGNAFVHNSSPVTVKISVDWLPTKVDLWIKDNGIGISQEDINHIFDRYYRGLDSRKTIGTGLGLAIAKESITANGGEVTVESEEGKGTTFKISLDRKV